MAKIIDYISLTIIVFLTTFVWSAYLFKGYVGAIIFSSAMALIAAVTIKYVRSRISKPYTYDRLSLELSLRGNAYVIDLIKPLLKADTECGSNYIVLKDAIVISAYKFSMVGVGDMGGIVALAGKYNKKRIYLIARGVERKAYAAVQIDGMRLYPVKVRTFYKLLKAHSALPDLKPVKEKPSLKAIALTALARSNFKAYAFSGAVLVLISFLTPLRIYYIVIGSISLFLAALTLTPLGNGELVSPSFLKEISESIDYKQ